jgi:hypothetical protein
MRHLVSMTTKYCLCKDVCAGSWQSEGVLAQVNIAQRHCALHRVEHLQITTKILGQ